MLGAQRYHLELNWTDCTIVKTLHCMQWLWLTNYSLEQMTTKLKYSERLYPLHIAARPSYFVLVRILQEEETISYGDNFWCSVGQHSVIGFPGSVSDSEFHSLDYSKPLDSSWILGNSRSARKVKPVCPQCLSVCAVRESQWVVWQFAVWVS